MKLSSAYTRQLCKLLIIKLSTTRLCAASLFAPVVVNLRLHWATLMESYEIQAKVAIKCRLQNFANKTYWINYKLKLKT